MNTAHGFLSRIAEGTILASRNRPRSSSRFCNRAWVSKDCAAAPLVLAVAGTAGAGKSTLVNALLGRPIPRDFFDEVSRHGPQMVDIGIYQGMFAQQVDDAGNAA